MVRSFSSPCTNGQGHPSSDSQPAILRSEFGDEDPALSLRNDLNHCVLPQKTRLVIPSGVREARYGFALRGFRAMNFSSYPAFCYLNTTRPARVYQGNIFLIPFFLLLDSLVF